MKHPLYVAFLSIMCFETPLTAIIPKIIVQLFLTIGLYVRLCGDVRTFLCKLWYVIC